MYRSATPAANSAPATGSGTTFVPGMDSLGFPYVNKDSPGSGLPVTGGKRLVVVAGSPGPVNGGS